MCVDCWNWKRCDSTVCTLANTNVRFGKAVQESEELKTLRDTYIPQYAELRMKGKKRFRESDHDQVMTLAVPTRSKPFNAWTL